MGMYCSYVAMLGWARYRGRFVEACAEGPVPDFGCAGLPL